MARAWKIRAAVASMAAICLSCSGTTPLGSSPDGGGGGSGDGGGGGGGGGGGKDGGIHPGGGGDGAIIVPGGDAGPTTPPGTQQCNITDPTKDMDNDGWTPNSGDCNDCDPNVNPGAIDVLHTPDGGTAYWGNESCNGDAGANAQPCDQGLQLADTDPNSAARAIELCGTASTSDKNFGVISATYVRANGTALAAPGLQTGIQSAWGGNVHVQAGGNMLALSTGHARSVGQVGVCQLADGGPDISCVTNASGTPPTGFPQDDPSCPKTTAIADDIALQVQLRVPTNATGYSFNFKFYSFEFPDWVCDTKGYNDQFVALVSPPPKGSFVPPGSTVGNISFDSNQHPVSVNMGFFDVCDPSSPTRFAQNCRKKDGGVCPATPSPYCPLGMGELAGTGFDVWDTKKGEGPAGATRWLQTTAPATGGSIITITFAIWDAGNSQYDSTVLIDNFQWIANGGAVGVSTNPPPHPQ